MNNKIKTMLAASVVTVTVLGVNNLKYESDKDIAESYRLGKLIELKLEQLKKEKEMDTYIDSKLKQIVKFKNSEEYANREERNKTIEYLKCKTGLNVVDYEEIYFTLSFYTDCPSENIPGKITTDCVGRKLVSYGVANNLFDLGQHLYIEGFGYKEVRDKGSNKHFNNYNKLDVFVPREYGESDDQYLYRVNNIGKITKKSYILKTV